MLDVHLERTSASLANEDLGGKKKKKTRPTDSCIWSDKLQP